MKKMKEKENTNNYSNKLPIGEWKIGDDEDFISFALKQKPHWFHRLMARFFFGLRWIDFDVPHDVKPSKGITVAKVIGGTPLRRFKGAHRK
jgi:hypothetical protein